MYREKFKRLSCSWRIQITDKENLVDENILQQEEIQLLLSQFSPEQENWRMKVKTALLSGLREGEILGSSGIIAGEEDRDNPEDESVDRENPGGPRPRFGSHPSQRVCRLSPRVVRVEADSVGSCRLFLEDDFLIEAFPANFLQGEYSERWRLFRPSEEGDPFGCHGLGVGK